MSESKVKTYESKSSPSSYGVATIPNLPEYKFVDETPKDGTGPYVAKTTGTVAIDWEIPSYAFNPSKCRIEFDIYTTNTHANAQSCACLADCSPLIKSASLKTANGELICEITDYFREFQKLSNSRFTSLKEYTQKDPSETFRKSDALATANKTVTPGDAKMSTNASSNYDENLHFVTSGTDIGADSALSQSAVSLPFSSMKNTFFCVDKVVYFPKKLKLQVKFGYPQESYFDYKDASTATNCTYIGTSEISNVHLYMCKDTNEENTKYLENLIATSGFRMMIPRVDLVQDIESGTNQIITVDLEQDKGGKIRKILLAPFNNATTSAPIIMDNSNAVTLNYDDEFNPYYTASKIYSYKTSLNSEPLQQSDVLIGDKSTSTGSQDWKEYRLKHPSGDDAFTSMGNYYYNWAIMHEFDKGLPVVPDISGGMTVIGKDNKFTAKIKASGANTYKWIKMSIYENILVISPTGGVAVLPY